jgi:hypothetical protein
VDSGNAPSIALLERAGMRREAHSVESLWFKGAWADEGIYAMLRREYVMDRGVWLVAFDKEMELAIYPNSPFFAVE